MDAELKIHDISRSIPSCHIHFFEETESTNTIAKELIRESSPLPFTVLTNRQTAGRGQHGKSWWSTSQSLTFSLAVKKPSSIQTGLIPLSVANIVAESIEEISRQLNPKIKWPNDVFLANRKAAGILVEKIENEGVDALVIGIGVNLNCSMSEAPDDIRLIATSIQEESGRIIDVNHYLTSLIQKLLKQFNNAPREQILPQFKERLLFPIGSRLTIEEPDGKKYTVEFVEISECGALIVKHNGNEKRIASGSIIDCNV